MVKYNVKRLPDTGPAVQVGKSLEWSSANQDAPVLGLTDGEIRHLQAKHKSANINQVRALAVKRLMSEGKTCGDIVKALRSRYGSRMIKGDHAALSESKKKALK